MANSIFQAILKADYEKHVNLFNEENVDKNGVVFLGDSIINYCPCDKYFEGNIINRGIPGDTTEGILNRLDQIIKIKPKIVIISAGTNDIVRINDSHENIAKRILKIKYLLEENIEDVKVYVVSLTPVLRDHEISSKTYLQHRTNEDIMEINNILELYINVIDVYYVLLDKNGNLNIEYTTDGLHLNELGYNIVSEIISSEVFDLKLKKKE